ncbi:MAG TPA: hypothetical protein H9796_12280 [Candidatus Butyricimonas faecavium]|nr:hypothetical protein [Candidatus Butyricimonas faecavium]
MAVPTSVLPVIHLLIVAVYSVSGRMVSNLPLMVKGVCLSVLNVASVVVKFSLNVK